VSCAGEVKKMESVGRLEWPDYVVLAVFLSISLGIGVYHSLTGGRQRTTEEFIMANRRLGIIPTTLSLFVSFQSAIMMLGLTAEMYMYGVQVLLWIPLGYMTIYLITERLVIPWLYPLKLVSVNAVSQVTFLMTLQPNSSYDEMSVMLTRPEHSRPRPRSSHNGKDYDKI